MVVIKAKRKGILKRFNGKGFHRYGSAYVLKSDAEKKAKELRNKDNYVRIEPRVILKDRPPVYIIWFLKK